MMKSIAAVALASASYANAYELEAKALGLMGYEEAIEGIRKFWLKPEHVTDSLDTYPTLTLAGEFRLSSTYCSYISRLNDENQQHTVSMIGPKSFLGGCGDSFFHDSDYQ